MEVAIIGCSIKQADVSSGHTSSGSVKAVIDAHFQSTNVKVVEVAVQSSIAVARLQISVLVLLELHAEEVSDMTKNDKNEIGDVCCKQEEVWWLIEHHFWKFTTCVSADIAMRRRVQRAKLRMLFRELSSLRRRRWSEQGGRRLVHVLGVCLCCRQGNCR